jgi:hypothetical protein
MTRHTAPERPRLLLVSLALAGLLTQAAAHGQPPPSDMVPPAAQPCPAGAGADGSRCPKLPCGAIPPPNGTYVRRWQELQAMRAGEDDFVVYKHEWCQGGPALGPYGRWHLGQIIKRLGGSPYTVVIQPDGDEGLNEARRLLIVTALAQAGVPDAARRVVVDFPKAEGLSGEEAERIYRRQFGGAGGYGGGGGSSGGGYGGVGGSLGGVLRGFGGTSIR